MGREVEVGISVEARVADGALVNVAAAVIVGVAVRLLIPPIGDAVTVGKTYSWVNAVLRETGGSVSSGVLCCSDRRSITCPIAAHRQKVPHRATMPPITALTVRDGIPSLRHEPSGIWMAASGC
jgi:hypothetical protein